MLSGHVLVAAWLIMSVLSFYTLQGGLTRSTRRDMLRDLFSAFGDITEVSERSHVAIAAQPMPT
jgi:RNA recognition motif. (a.k.a. RRM, RBD, or RNP domain)